ISTPCWRAFSSCSNTCCALSIRLGSPSSLTQPSRVVTFTPRESSRVFKSLRSLAYSDCKARGLSNCRVRVSVIDSVEQKQVPFSCSAAKTTGGNDGRATIIHLSETIHERPVRAFLWRFLDADYDKVTAGSFWNNMRSREVTFLPPIRLFCQLSIRIINVYGNLCPVDFCS